MLEIEQTGTLTEPLVGLLKRDDICAQLTDDIGGTTGVEAPVGADAFVDVVGGDDDIATADRGFAMNDGGASLADRSDDPRR